jgi:hypothetical protein
VGRMTRQRWFLAGCVLAAMIAGVCVFKSRGRERLAVDLVKEFSTAKKQPNAGAFSIIDATIAGITKRAIFTAQASRITWRITVPEDGPWLRVSLGLKEEGWTMPGDGVRFLIIMSDGKTSDNLMALDVNPYGNPSDRQWKEVALNLEQYAGETLDLMFTVYSGPPSGKDDRNGDLALWGAPRLVER